MARPAVVHEAMDLFSWARSEAARIALAREEQAARIRAVTDAEMARDLSPAWSAYEAAKRDLANARKAALEEDLAVADAKEAVKQARRATKGLPAVAALKDAKAAAKLGEQGIRTAEQELAARLVGGEAPSTSEPTKGGTTVELIGPDGSTTGPMPFDEFSRRTKEVVRRVRAEGRRP